MTYPRPSRTRSALLSQTASLSNGRPRAAHTSASSLLPGIDDDLLEDSELLNYEYEDDDGLAAFDKRSEELLRAGMRTKAGSLVSEDCAKCKRYLDHATKLQVQVNEAKQALEALREENGREKQAWTEEKVRIERT
jgi:hypothetical protein